MKSITGSYRVAAPQLKRSYLRLPEDNLQEQKDIPALSGEERAALTKLSESPNDSGIQEAQLFQRAPSIRDLKKEAEEADHGRDQRFRNHFEWIAIISLYCVSVFFLICGFVWVLQLVLPEKIRWLAGEKLDKLQDVVTGGAFLGLILDHFRKRTKSPNI